MKSLFKSTNHSCESLTERDMRRSSAEILDIQAYLGQLQSTTDRKVTGRKVLKLSADKQKPIRKSLYANASVKDLGSTFQIPPPRPVTISRNRFASQRSTILNKQASMQEQYEEMNWEKIQQLNDALLKLISQLLKLKDEMNNDRKLYIKIQKLIGVKRNLGKLLLNQETENIVEPLTLFHLKQNICQKEHILDGTSPLTIETYNFAVIRDINYLLEKMEEVSIQTEVNRIKALEYKITDEIYSLKAEENKMAHKRVASPKLRFQQRMMRTAQFPEGSMELIESRFGPFPLIQNRNKIIHNQIQNIINNLNSKFKN